MILEGFSHLSDSVSPQWKVLPRSLVRLPEKVSSPQSELDLPFQSQGKGARMPQTKTSRRAAVYLPPSKGNQSKPGMHEPGCGSRKPMSTESLQPILTAAAGQRLVSRSPAHAKHRSGLGSACRQPSQGV